MRVALSVVAVSGLLMAGAWLQQGGAGIANAETLSVDVVATGAEENPPVTSPGTARARFTFDTETRELTYAVTVNGVSETQVTAAHIHRGGVGTNGPVVYPLSLEPFTITSGSISLTPEDAADLAAGDFYLNVHSLTHPGGFARAQIILPGLETTPADASASVTPPSTGDAGLEGAGESPPWFEVAALIAASIAMGFILSRRNA